MLIAFLRHGVDCVGTLDDPDCLGLRAEICKLKGIIKKKDDQLGSQAAELRHLKEHKRKLMKRRESKAEKASEEDSKRKHQMVEKCEFKTVGGTHMTPRGAFSVLSRRCLANLSARGVGFMLQRDLHHSTLSKWEIRMRASLNAAAREFFARAAYSVASHAMSGVN